MPDQKKSSAKSPRHSDAQIAVSMSNLENCLTGLDQGGEEGLQGQLDKIYGPRPLTRVPLPNFPGSSASLLPEPENFD